MGIFSRFESRVEDTVEGAANKMFDSPISPVQIAKKAEKQMRREKMLGAGKQYAPTLYTILVNINDDERLFGYYPTLAGETETYLSAKAMEEGLVMDGHPLVRFIADEGLKHGKFEVIAELVASPIVDQLRAEEMDRYGINSRAVRVHSTQQPVQKQKSEQAMQNNMDQQQQSFAKPQLPYVPKEEIDYSIDYGEYTFDSQNFDEQQEINDPAAYYQASDEYESESKDDYIQDRNSVPLDRRDPASNFDENIAAQAVHSRPDIPHTVVFAPGAGSAHPTPNKALVRARLMDTNTNRSYDLATNRFLIGRDKKSDIFVDDINASRSHAELKYEPQGVWTISDLGSTNGTFVNGEDISTQTLNDGDYLTVGTSNFLFIQEQ